ncbi:MAG: hypothetical protein ACI8PP_002583 [Candidatus Pseudothioglobus sp.]
MLQKRYSNTLMTKLIRTASLSLLLCLAIGLLSSCASLSKDECLYADWQIIGYEDAAAGRGVSRLGEHRKACADHAVVPDKVAYEDGYDEGLQTFCTFDRGLSQGRKGEAANAVCHASLDFLDGHDSGVRGYCTFTRGFEEGSSGQSYQRVCPADLEQNFLSGFNQGRSAFDLSRQIDGIAYRLDEIRQLRKNADAELAAIRPKLAYDATLNGSQRTQLLQRLEALSARSAELDQEAEAISFEAGQLQAELEQTRDF